MNGSGDVYSAPQRALHWIMAILIFGMVPLGIYMHEIPWPPNPGANPEWKSFLYETHKTFGLIVLFLACARVIVRVVKGAPAPVATLTPLERRVSAATHHLLYVLIFAVPITGYIATSMCCSPVSLFNAIPMPVTFTGGEVVYRRFFQLHKLLAILMTLIVFAHMGAALMHRFVKKDGVMRRMIG